MPYEKGQEIRAEFEATVVSVNDSNLRYRSQVLEDNGFIHYLYLGDREARTEILKDPRYLPAAGDRISVRLTARICEVFVFPVAGVSQVITARTYVHCLNLASPSVRASEPAYEIGQEIRAEFEATVITNGGEKYGTGRVREDNGTEHFLFLIAREEILRGNTKNRPAVNDRISVAFTAVIKAPEPAYPPPSGTTLVSTGRRWNHCLNLASPSVRLAGGTPVIPVSKTTSAPVKLTQEQQDLIAKLTGKKEIAEKKEEKGKTVAINRDSQKISSDDVKNRLREIEDGQGYEVVRVRNNEVLFTDNEKDAEEACRQYIEDEDYNPEQVIVRIQDLGEKNAAELSRLRALQDEATRFGSNWTLYRENYFGIAWAKSQARGELDLSFYRNLDGWPFSEINWAKAASSRRDARYSLIEFDGRNFYGKDS
jgi:predicted secreted protein